jgi:hypothetical protein
VIGVCSSIRAPLVLRNFGPAQLIRENARRHVTVTFAFLVLDPRCNAVLVGDEAHDGSPHTVGGK